MLRIRKPWIAVLLSVLSWPAGAGTAQQADNPANWVPARWSGGPLELARRAASQAAVTDSQQREAIAGWYDPATLDLLAGTPINCLLVTFHAVAGAAVQARQRELVRKYAAQARERGIAVLGIVYPGGDPGPIAAEAKAAGLRGLVLDGEFPAGFGAGLESALRRISSTARVIPIHREPAAASRTTAPLLAVQGVKPSVRNLSDMGVRATASAEPWIDSNIWLVRLLQPPGSTRPVWIDQQPDPNSVEAYLRSVADAAVAGGRWIIALDDDLRARLYRRDARALAVWKRMAAYSQFAEEHAAWRRFAPYGNLAIIHDPNNGAFADEYLNLVARRQVPYRIVPRSGFNAGAVAGFQALLAAGLSPATEGERTMLRDFAGKGGLVVAGASWGGAPRDESYAEVPIGAGRVAVYHDDPPDPEAVAKDLRDLMTPEAMGFSVFNVPSSITFVSASGNRVLVQLLDYSDRPYGRITFRLNGSYRRARLYTPEEAPSDLDVRVAAPARTEVSIAKPAAWTAVVLE